MRFSELKCTVKQ